MSATSSALRLLIAERDRLDRAIAALQTADADATPRRGRPPGSKNKKAAKRRGRPPMSEAERKAASVHMKKLWAKRRRAAKSA